MASFRRDGHILPVPFTLSSSLHSLTAFNDKPNPSAAHTIRFSNQDLKIYIIIVWISCRKQNYNITHHYTVALIRTSNWYFL